MTEAIIYQSLLIIFFLTFSFGPAFFALINAGIKDGVGKGVFLALGIVFSDLFLAILISFLFHFGAHHFLEAENSQNYSAYIGGAILIIFGFSFFVQRTLNKENEIEGISRKGGFLTFIKGFFLNIFNPSVWFIWIGNVSIIGKQVAFNLPIMIIYFVLIMAIVFVVEVGKVIIAGKIKHLLTDKMMKIVNYCTGIALIVFGVILILNHL